MDEGFEIRFVFFYLSKTLDKVWHEGLIFKLSHGGINGKLLEWLLNYLSNRRQKVILPGGQSNAQYINVGVPQRPILGPLLFLVFINDFVENIESAINLFADDTSLSLIIRNPNDAGQILQRDIEKKKKKKLGRNLAGQIQSFKI